MYRCQRRSSKNWFPPLTMCALGVKLRSWGLVVMRFHSLVTSLAFWKLLTFLCTEAMYPSNSFNPMFLRAIHIQVLATFLLSLDSDNYRPNNSSGISFYINPQIPSHPTIHMIFFLVVLRKFLWYMQKVCLVFIGKDTEQSFRRIVLKGCCGAQECCYQNSSSSDFAHNHLLFYLLPYWALCFDQVAHALDVHPKHLKDKTNNKEEIKME